MAHVIRQEHRVQGMDGGVASGDVGLHNLGGVLGWVGGPGEGEGGRVGGNMWEGHMAEGTWGSDVGVHDLS